MDFQARRYCGRGLRRRRCGASHSNPVVDLDHWARSGEVVPAGEAASGDQPPAHPDLETDADVVDGSRLDADPGTDPDAGVDDGPAGGPGDRADPADRRPASGRSSPEIDAVTAELIRRLQHTLDDARPQVGMPPSSSRSHLQR